MSVLALGGVCALALTACGSGGHTPGKLVASPLAAVSGAAGYWAATPGAPSAPTGSSSATAAGAGAAGGAASGATAAAPSASGKAFSAAPSSATRTPVTPTTVPKNTVKPVVNPTLVNPTVGANAVSCSLLTVPEVSSTLGAPVVVTGAGQSGAVGGQTCTWATQTTPPTGFGIVLVRQTDISQAGETPATFFAQEVAGARKTGPVTALTGPWDQAYVSTATDSITSERIFVLKKDVTMTVFVYTGQAGISDDAVKSLTRLAADRL